MTTLPKTPCCRAPLQRCRIEARLKPRPTYVSVFLIRFACCALLGVTLVACRKAEPEPAPVAPVQVSPVIKGSIRVIVNADAVLFPREQANIVP